MNWDEFFVGMAKYVATKSKDPSTKCGVVIVGEDNTVLGIGYNGFPRGVDDNPELYADRSIKYQRVVHAEANAIANCARLGIRMKGATMYTSFGSNCCNECAKLIIQSGIVAVIGEKQKETFGGGDWCESIKVGRDMFEQAGINLKEI
jgi:dCMP deaminase